MDVSAIEPGRDFRIAIDESVATCSVLLALLGLDWLEAKDADGRRRLDDPNDFVRIELASALRRDIPVVPVLVRGARMPRAEQLPGDLKELAFRNAVELTHARWKSDMQVLVQALARYVDSPAVKAPAMLESQTPVQAQGASSTNPEFESLPAIDPQIVDRVKRALAVYIGPIAEVVVRRAAKRSGSNEDFYIAAAREIESESDRVTFLKSCRK